MTESDSPREFSSGRKNYAVVRVSLATGQARVLGRADTAQEATDATRRAATKNKDVPIFASSAS